MKKEVEIEQMISVVRYRYGFFLLCAKISWTIYSNEFSLLRGSDNYK